MGLLEEGADANAQQEGGMSPLHEAVHNDNVELVDLLLRFGANPHLSNDEGDSPLQLSQSRIGSATAARLEAALPD